MDSTKTPTIRPDYVTDHNKKGWTTTKTWEDYLLELRYTLIPINPNFSYYDRENRIYLISDSYGSHDCSESTNFATTLNIDIITVPKGLTSKYQPLDLKINGNFKSQQKTFINE